MSVTSEFKSIDLIINSTAETRGVDAFALSVIKAERQLRRLLTHMVFQFPCFDSPDIPGIRNALANKRQIYFDEVEKCIDSLCSVTVETMTGSEYGRLREKIREAMKHRNKIFHGQLTALYLTRDYLIDLVSDVRAWCDAVGSGALVHIGYDGFTRNSFQKSANPHLSATFKIQLNSVNDYDQFLESNQRSRKK